MEFAVVFFSSYFCTRKIRTCIVLTSNKLDYAKEKNAQVVLQLQAHPQERGLSGLPRHLCPRGIELTNQDLITFLARYTNLGSEASIKTLFYRYKQQIHV